MSENQVNHSEIASQNIWTVDIPDVVKRTEKLPDDSELLILIQEGKADAFIITDVTSKDEFVKKWIDENREFNEKMVELGD